MPSEDPASAGGRHKAAETVDVVLISAGNRRIEVVKALRAARGRGLWAGLTVEEANALVHSAPTVVRGGVEHEEAGRLKAALEEVGAKVELVTRIERLIGALGDQDSEVRIRAAEELGKLRDQRAVEPLVAALGSVGQPAYAALFSLHSAGLTLPDDAMLAMRRFGPNPYVWAT